MVAIRLMPFSPFDTITRSCFPMRLLKAFTKEGSVSRPLYGMLFILCGAKLRIQGKGKQLTEPSPHRKTPHAAFTCWYLSGIRG